MTKTCYAELSIQLHDSKSTSDRNLYDILMSYHAGLMLAGQTFVIRWSMGM